jgi:hypothetical protein
LDLQEPDQDSENENQTTVNRNEEIEVTNPSTGTTYTQKSQESEHKKLTDETGFPVPDHLVPVFETRGQFKKDNLALSRMLKRYEDAVKNGETAIHILGWLLSA